MPYVLNKLSQCWNSGIGILGVLLLALTSLIDFSYQNINDVSGQLVVISNINPNASIDSTSPNTGQSSPQQPPGFVIKGTINSVMSFPAGKWLTVGDLDVTLNNGNVVFFNVDMTWYNISGTSAHTHELTNFKPVSGEGVLSRQIATDSIIIRGVADIGTNGVVSWNEVPISIGINGTKIVFISVDKNKTNHHFGGQPILGIANSFVPCSDQPGANMEVLPPCSQPISASQNFNDTNSSSAHPENFIPYSTELENNEGTESAEQSIIGGSSQSEDSPGIEQLVPSDDRPTADESSFPSSSPSTEGAPIIGGSSQSENVLNSSNLLPLDENVQENSAKCTQQIIKNLRASGFETDPVDFHPPFDAIDGDSMTWWSNKDENSWLQLELGQHFVICGLNIQWNKGDAREYEFEIGVSETGADFKKVFEGANKKGSSVAESYSFDPVNGRYVELTITGTSSDAGWVSIKEISILGRPTD